ncbi:hypothetical protein HK102_001950, partial [Quaeritorhiza haematococci]
MRQLGLTADTLRSTTSTLDGRLIRTTILNPPIPDLHQHLISVFFTIMHREFPVFHEGTFFENLVPVNRHPPAVINAMYAVACLFSQHPDLYKEPFGSPRKAGAHFAKKSEEELKHITDPVSNIQALMSLGLWGYGDAVGAKALIWLNHAARQAQQMGLDKKSGNNYFFSIWQAPPSGKGRSIDEAMRFRGWATCFMMDTFATCTSGVLFTIHEADYVGLLYGMENDEDASTTTTLTAINGSPLSSKFGHSLGDVDDVTRGFLEDPQNGWRNFDGGYPTYTIFDRKYDTGGNETVETVINDPHSLPSIDSLYSARHQKYMLQLCFLLRRILRFLFVDRSATPSSQATGSSKRWTRIVAPLLSAMTPSTDITTLHDTLLEWYDVLPPEMKAFDSLEDFCAFAEGVGDDTRQYTPPPFPSPENPPGWTKSPLGVFGNMIFICAFVFLHHKNVDNPDRIFRTSLAKSKSRDGPGNNGGGGCSTLADEEPSLMSGSGVSPPPRRISSMDILRICFAAHVWIVKCVHVVVRVSDVLPFSPADLGAGGGGGTATASSTSSSSSSSFGGGAGGGGIGGGGENPFRFSAIPFSEQYPAPPWQLVQSPLMSFFLYVTSSAVTTLFLQDAVIYNRNNSETVATIVHGLRNVVIPLIDNISRVWKVAGLYSQRLRVLLRDVLRRSDAARAADGGVQRPRNAEAAAEMTRNQQGTAAAGMPGFLFGGGGAAPSSYAGVPGFSSNAGPAERSDGGRKRKRDNGNSQMGSEQVFQRGMDIMASAPAFGLGLQERNAAPVIALLREQKVKK